jgi:hypothetical protein
VRRLAPLAFLAAVVLAPGAARAGAATPLFSGDGVIDVTVAGDIGDLVRKSPRAADPHPATLAHGGDVFPIALSARGNARRRPENCSFPPLRVRFDAKPAAPSLFAGQKTLKLVTHCRGAKSFQQITLLEFSVYRMLNALTDQSFRVRLARLRYVEAKSGKLYAERMGFFIEDLDDLADRVDMEEVRRKEAPLAQHDRQAAARAVLFNYMIANHDWSMSYAPEGEDCCHNGKLIAASAAATSGLVYVPYDFDYAGFVDAPYAVPPDQIPVRTVRQRHYRGKCAMSADVVAAASDFRARKDAIYSAVAATPEMTEKTKAKARKFLDGFFKEIADDAAAASLAARCD